jgi:hypothetical protein
MKKAARKRLSWTGAGGVPDQSASFSTASCASRSNNARWSCSLYRGSWLDCRSFSTRARESSNTSLRRRDSNWAGVNCLFLPELSLSSNSCTWPSTALLSHPLAMRSFYGDDCLGSRNFSRSVSCANIDCPVYKCFCIWILRLGVGMQASVKAKSVCCRQIHNVSFWCGRGPASWQPLSV